MSEDQDMTTAGVYYDSDSRTWIYHDRGRTITQSPPMAEDDNEAAERWFLQVGWLKPLHCWSLGPLTCGSLMFKYVNAMPGAGYVIQGRPRWWYWLQGCKGQWNRLVARFCDQTCPNR
jgi:hypothetical protein